MSAQEAALAALLDELERLREAGGSLPAPAELAERFGLGEDAVRDVFAGLEALEDAADDSSESVHGAASLPLPDLGDDYEVGDELGRGGMGVVYRAHQRSLGREVAVKVLRPGQLVFGEALERFDRETRALAKLRHPNIAAIHEVGRTEGELFFTMDLIEGGTLGDLLKQQKRPLPFAYVVELLRKVAGAIGFVHRHGLVHRDLKPANVLLDEEGEPYVVDFGLAVDAAGGHTLTATGRLLGTPAYMAPEQARGERALVTERTDIYALGVMLYELCCGVAPFQRAGLVDTIHAVVHDDPRPPSKERPDMPRALENVILKAMAKDPARRYGTAEALAEDLRRFAAGEPIEAEAPSMTRAFRRGLRRQRGAIAGLVVGVAVAAMLWVGPQRRLIIEGAESRLRTVRELQEAGSSEIAARLAKEARDGLPESGPWSAAGETLVFEALVADLAELDALAGDGMPPEGRLAELRAGIDALREGGGHPLRCAVLEVGLQERGWAGKGRPDYKLLRDARGPIPAPERFLSRKSGRFLRSSSLFGDWWDRMDHPLLGLLEFLGNGSRLAGIRRWEDHEAVARLGLAQIERDPKQAEHSGFGRSINLARPSVLLNPEFEDLSARSLERFEALVMGEDDRKARLASELLCHLLDLPVVEIVEKERVRRNTFRVVSKGPLSLETRAQLIQVARARARLDPVELRIAEAAWVGRAVLELPNGLTSSYFQANHWLDAKLALEAPSPHEEFSDWWAALPRLDPLALLSEGLGLGPEAALAEALAKMAEVQNPSDVQRIHEWLVLQAPRWKVEVPTRRWNINHKYDREAARSLLTEWRERAGGHVRLPSIGLAVLRWRGGIDAPTLAWEKRLEVNGAEPSGVEAVGTIGGDWKTTHRPTWDVGTRWQVRRPGRPVFTGMEPDGEATLFVEYELWPVRIPEGTAIQVSSIAWTRTPSGDVNGLGSYRSQGPAWVARGEARAAGDFLARESGGRGERVTLIVLGLDEGDSMPESTPLAWSQAFLTRLHDSLETRMAVDRGTLARDLEVAARLVHDFDDDARVASRGRALLEQYMQLTGDERNGRDSDELRAAAALEAILDGETSAGIASQLKEMHSGEWQAVAATARLAMRDAGEASEVAQSWIEGGAQDVTRGELLAMKEAGVLGPRRTEALEHQIGNDARTRWRRSFLVVTCVLMLFALIAGPRGMVSIGAAVIWMGTAAGVFLLGPHRALDGLFQVPAAGFLIVVASARSGRHSWTATPILVGSILLWIAGLIHGRAALDALAMLLAAFGCFSHSFHARKSDGRGVPMVGAWSALILGVLFLVPASISAAIAIAGEHVAMGGLQSLPVSLLKGGLAGTLVALLFSVLHGPGAVGARGSRGGLRGLRPVPPPSDVRPEPARDWH